MIEILQIIATSWPIALMVIVVVVALVLNRRWKQVLDDSQAVRDLRSSQAMVVRDSRED